MENASSNKVNSDGWRTVLSNDSNSASNDGWRTVLSNDFSSQHENYIQPKAPASLSQVPQGALNAVKNFIPDIPRSAYELGKGLVYDPITKTYKNIKEQGVAKGAEMAGKSLANTAGDIVKYYGQKGTNIIVDPMGELQRQGEFIQERPAMAAMNVATALEGGGALTGVKGITAVGKAINPVNIAGKTISGIANKVIPSLELRGTGFTSAGLKKGKGYENATAVSKAAFDKGVVPITGNVHKAVANAESLAETTGQALDKIRTTVANTTGIRYDPITLIRRIREQIQPELLANDQGGILEQVISNVYNEVPNFTEKGISIEQAIKLVKKLQKKGEFKWNAQPSEAANAQVYQQASGIARSMLDDAVERAGNKIGNPDLLKQYAELKKTYSQSQDMIVSLKKQRGTLAGTSGVPFVSGITGASMGFLAHNPALGVAVAGASELYKRRPGVYTHAARATSELGKGISKVSPYGAIPQFALNALNNKVNEKRSK